MSKRKKFAPYVYLTRSSNGKDYQLFVSVRTDIGYKIQGAPKVSFNGNVTEVNINVQSAGGRQAETYNKKVMLKPRIGYPHGTFNPNDASFSIKIAVEMPNGTSNTTQMVYQDSDFDHVKNTLVKKGFAFNCPYVHLARISSGKFEPHLIVGLQGYELIQGAERIIKNYPNRGHFKSALVLTIKARNSELLKGDSLETNKKKYNDANESDDFTAFVFSTADNNERDQILNDLNHKPYNNHMSNGPHPKKRRKAKVRNMYATN